MILLGLGANLSHPVWGTPRETCKAALAALDARGVAVTARSAWYRSRPVPASDQPWFVNGAAVLETGLAPAELLALLHEIEADFGRVRRVVNAARTLDLDLLAFEGLTVGGPGLVLPHPRLQDRAFVLLPVAEIAPSWRHPVSGLTARELLARLPDNSDTELF